MADDDKDAFELERFVTAQARDYSRAVCELRGGRKQTHWIWFVFPQMRGLGRSATAEHFGITSLEEARAYLAHPLLGARLEEVTRLMLDLEGVPLSEVLGSPDDMKFRSSMTLFAVASGPGSLYEEALLRLWGGEACDRTLELLRG